jgi:hypothetical protein
LGVSIPGGVIRASQRCPTDRKGWHEKALNQMSSKFHQHELTLTDPTTMNNYNTESDALRKALNLLDDGTV